MVDRADVVVTAAAAVADATKPGFDVISHMFGRSMCGVDIDRLRQTACRLPAV